MHDFHPLIAFLLSQKKKEEEDKHSSLSTVELEIEKVRGFMPAICFFTLSFV
jgi:hypothetical protein